MLIKKVTKIASSEITDQSLWLERRQFIKRATLVGLAIGACGAVPRSLAVTRTDGDGLPSMQNVRDTSYGDDLEQELTAYDDILSYTNFYEFGTDKGEATGNSDVLNSRPWIIRVDGECEKPGEIGIEDILSGFTQEERIYRLRCVEAWAMVVPWIGFPLADLLKRFQPTSRAKYVAFETLYDAESMYGMLDGPYREGLRIDEAMHPLALLATGLYGNMLATQNGAPLRLVVPWKYGYKSIKSIVRITFSETMPDTTWTELGPRDYGFFGNVNPNVDHRMWSQRRHRVIGDSLFADKQDTLMFNGYADEVSGLYKGMDLKRNF